MFNFLAYLTALLNILLKTYPRPELPKVAPSLKAKVILVLKERGQY